MSGRLVVVRKKRSGLCCAYKESHLLHRLVGHLLRAVLPLVLRRRLGAVCLLELLLGRVSENLMNAYWYLKD